MFQTLRTDFDMKYEYLKARFDITDEEGATAVEYGLLVGAIAIAVAAAATTLSGRLQTKLESIIPGAGS